MARRSYHGREFSPKRNGFGAQTALLSPARARWSLPQTSLRRNATLSPVIDPWDNGSR
jgi:hypothetical protein